MADVVRGCIEKRRYDTRAIAESVARDCLRQRGHVLRVYLCDSDGGAGCGGWHLSSRNVELVEARPGWRPAKVSQRDAARHRYIDAKRGRRTGRR
jgi:hypothetical protein